MYKRRRSFRRAEEQRGELCMYLGKPKVLKNRTNLSGRLGRLDGDVQLQQTPAHWAVLAERAARAEFANRSDATALRARSFYTYFSRIFCRCM